jgi:D-arabinose 1-dehydrogenase-like Zn-dependent alcohol dehydrogenase
VPASVSSRAVSSAASFTSAKTTAAAAWAKRRAVTASMVGHVGVKIARAMGAEVTVLSQSSWKKDDGLALGANHYYATSDPAVFENLANTFDLILNTVSAPLDLDAYLRPLAFDGTMVNLGASAEPLPLRVRVRQPPLLHQLLDRRHRSRTDQPGVGAGPRLRRAIPLCHRYLHPRRLTPRV